MFDNSSGEGRRFSLPFHLNLPILLLTALLAYFMIYSFSFLTSKKTDVYEVRMGTLAEDTVYRGIALRNEVITKSEYTGIVNFYNKETDRIGAGGLAYTVDEKGELQEYLRNGEGETSSLTPRDYAAFRDEIIDFTNDFDLRSFQTVYDLKNSMMSASQKVSNRSILEGIEDLSSTSIHTCYAGESGDIIYSVDGMESLTFETLSLGDFNESSYKKTTIENNQQIKKGAPVYKVSTSEKWGIAIRAASEEEAQAMVAEQYLEVRFLKNSTSAWASVTARNDESGNWFVLLSFTNSMVNFCTDRYLDIEIITNQRSGLKVPNSSITKGEFFLIPHDFLTIGQGGEKGVLLEVYNEDAPGSRSVEFIPSTPYSETEDYYYLDQSVLRAGEIIDMPGSSAQYTLGEMAELTGVYYINKGYADFRQVNILSQNEEFAIVESGALYGLMEYDYIVLYADTINPEEFVHH